MVYFFYFLVTFCKKLQNFVNFLSSLCHLVKFLKTQSNNRFAEAENGLTAFRQGFAVRRYFADFRYFYEPTTNANASFVQL